MRMYTVFDSAALAYLPPFASKTNGMAMRMFVDACCSKDQQFNTHPKDYSLYLIGDFDEDSGELRGCEKKCLLTAVEAIAMANEEVSNVDPVGNRV